MAAKRARLQAALRVAKRSRFTHNGEIDPTSLSRLYKDQLEHMIRSVPSSKRNQLEIEGRLGTLKKRRRRTDFKSGVPYHFFETVRKTLTEHMPPKQSQSLDLYYDVGREQIRVSVDPTTNAVLGCLIKRQQSKVDVPVKDHYALRLTTSLEIPVRGDTERSKTAQLLQPVHPWWRIQCGCDVKITGEFQGDVPKDVAHSLLWSMAYPPCSITTTGDMLQRGEWKTEVPSTIILSNRAGRECYEAQHTITIAPQQCTPLVPHGYTVPTAKPALYRLKKRYSFQLSPSISVDLTESKESRRSLETIYHPHASTTYEVEYEMDGEKVPVTNCADAAQTMLKDIQHILYTKK